MLKNLQADGGLYQALKKLLGNHGWEREKVRSIIAKHGCFPASKLPLLTILCPGVGIGKELGKDYEVNRTSITYGNETLEPVRSDVRLVLILKLNVRRDDGVQRLTCAITPRFGQIPNDTRSELSRLGVDEFLDLSVKSVIYRKEDFVSISKAA